MSILIKGILMPKYGELNITIDALGSVAYTDMDMKAHDVIEIPTPHGRLIDADAVDTRYSDPEVVETLNEAPTIIEADKEKEDEHFN